MFLVIDRVSDKDFDFVPGTGGLTKTQVTAVERALCNGWASDRIVSSDETRALLVIPPDNDNLDTSFYICADGYGLKMSIMQGDDLRPYGTFEDIDALLAALWRWH